MAPVCSLNKAAALNSLPVGELLASIDNHDAKCRPEQPQGRQHRSSMSHAPTTGALPGPFQAQVELNTALTA